MLMADGFLARWLFRLSGYEMEPVQLRQRRIFVLPTRVGLAYAVTVLLALVGAMNYALSLAYLLTFLLAGLGMVAMLHCFRNLFGLSLRSGHEDAVFLGEPARLRVVVRNPANRVRPAVTLHFADEPGQTLDLAAESEYELVLQCTTRRRGWCQAGRITIETRYPLGLVRAWGYAMLPARCLVYPRPEQSAPPLPWRTTSVGTAPARVEGDEDFAGLRRFQAADSPRRVAWKQVARGSPLLTKSFDAAAGLDCVLDYADLPAQMDAEQRLSRLARWVLDAEAMGAEYALSLPGDSISRGRGRLQLERCLRALALFGEAVT